jgi:ABC-type long-subunit fatty acid transport system fused permease/ATPase subunit
MQTITIPKEKFELLKREIETLRNTSIYKRLLEFEKNISIKKFTRKDLGF